jgi:hypothetical protein
MTPSKRPNRGKFARHYKAPFPSNAPKQESKPIVEPPKPENNKDAAVMRDQRRMEHAGMGTGLRTGYKPQV